MNFVMDIINNYGLIAILIAIMIEYACFPLPSEVILPLAGALAINNNYNFFYILFLSVIVGDIGACFCYFLGRLGGNKVLTILKKIYPKSDEGIEEAQKKYLQYSSYSVSLGRMIPLCRTYISFIAGISKQNFLKYLIFTTIGISIWNFLLIFLGYKFYQNLDYVASFYDKYKIIVLLIIGIIIICYQFYKLIKTKNIQNKKV